ncbi:hypothetical protein ABIE38_003502 [Dietzia sp. 2505]|uniref:AlbA family DNA-binding domain-containing protein n=1 Tax=Dietzia sp. 2505 TaxID=3156457 RepID=UPI00339607D8
MTFTAIHRAVGVESGPLTDGLLDQAVSGGVMESNDLDWKSALPPARGLGQTDFPKDVAAMANSGGGIIVYGVTESQRSAAARTDVGVLDEKHERALRAAAINAITPPVFGLEVLRIGEHPKRAVVVEVPASLDGPHLIYRGEYFGAPIRNDADTVWMREPQIEAMYRARFDERRHSTETLDTLYAEAARGRDADRRAWLIAVAHPRSPRFFPKLNYASASEVFENAHLLGREFTGQTGYHPLESADTEGPRPGLRRWVAPSKKAAGWKQAWASVHQSGSVTLATPVGGHPFEMDAGGKLMHRQGFEIESSAFECTVADFMGLVRAGAQVTGNHEYDLRIGIEWTVNQRLSILRVDQRGVSFDDPARLHGFTLVERSVDAAASERTYADYVYEVARDCLNQGEILEPRMIDPPPAAWR